MAGDLARQPTGRRALTRPERRSALRGAARRFFARRLVVVGSVLAATLVFFGLFGSLVAPYSAVKADLLNPLAPPGGAHLLGTDQLGRDVLSRVMVGASVSLQVGVGAVLLAALPGTFIGLFSGYRGGLADGLIMRVLDGFMAFPSIVLALTIVSILGPSLVNVLLAIAATIFPLYARLVRGQVLAVREFGYITAIRTVGARETRIIIRHILPNVVSPVIVQASLGVGAAIVTEASLGFLGLGVQPPAPTWGSMLQTGFQFLASAPWLPIAPASVIFMAVLGFNLLGDGLREALDPNFRPTG